MSAGGDDIDFPGMLFNCILGVHITGGPVKRTCTDQQTFTWGLLNNGKYIDDLGRVIDAIMQKGRQGPKGNDFRLYLTGYGRFFNADTTGSDTNCDKTTFVSLTSGILVLSTLLTFYLTASRRFHHQETYRTQGCSVCQSLLGQVVDEANLCFIVTPC